MGRLTAALSAAALALGAAAADFRVDGFTGAAVQSAVDAALAAGGGRVVVGPGEYAVASIRLGSGIELHLEKGAVLKGSTASRDYDDFPDEVCSIRPEGSRKVLVYAYDADGVAVTGEGVIDGSGPEFFVRKTNKWGFWDKPAVERPRMVQFVRCRNVRLEGVRFKDSPGWTMLIRLCDGVDVDGIRVTGDQRMINNDGIDFDGCRRVRVRRSEFRTGDDCLIVRAMREHGADERVVCEDVEFADCVLDSACQTIRLGCPSDDTIRNVRIRNVRARGNNGIFADFPARYLRPDDEGFMDMTGIVVEGYSGTFRGSAVQIVSEDGVKIRRADGFVFRDIDVDSARPLRFVGTAGCEIGSVKLENAKIKVRAGGGPVIVKGCLGLSFSNVEVNGARLPDGPVASEPGSAAPLARAVTDSWETQRQKRGEK